MTAKQLKEAAKVDTSLTTEEPGHVPELLGYYFDVEEFEAFCEAYGREQRLLCFKHYKDNLKSNRSIVDLIMHAKPPEL